MEKPQICTNNATETQCREKKTSSSVIDKGPCLRTAKSADLKYRTFVQYTVLNLCEGCLHPSVILGHSFDTKLLLNPEQVCWIWISKTEMKKHKQSEDIVTGCLTVSPSNSKSSIPVKIYQQLSTGLIVSTFCLWMREVILL